MNIIGNSAYYIGGVVVTGVMIYLGNRLAEYCKKDNAQRRTDFTDTTITDNQNTQKKQRSVTQTTSAPVTSSIQQDLFRKLPIFEDSYALLKNNSKVQGLNADDMSRHVNNIIEQVNNENQDPRRTALTRLKELSTATNSLLKLKFALAEGFIGHIKNIQEGSYHLPRHLSIIDLLAHLVAENQSPALDVDLFAKLVLVLKAIKVEKQNDLSRISSTINLINNFFQNTTVQPNEEIIESFIETISEIFKKDFVNKNSFNTLLLNSSRFTTCISTNHKALFNQAYTASQ